MSSLIKEVKLAGLSGGIVGVGGSAGSIGPLLEILESLPPEFQDPIVAVIHRPKSATQKFAEVFRARVSRPVEEPDHGEKIKQGVFYLAPSGHHLLIDKSRRFQLSDLKSDCVFMPSIDELFITAAEAYSGKGVAVLLSGAGNDGIKGLKKWTSLGGKSVIQGPETAQVQILPREAVRQVSQATVMRPEMIGHHILENYRKFEKLTNNFLQTIKVEL